MDVDYFGKGTSMKKLDTTSWVLLILLTFLELLGLILTNFVLPDWIVGFQIVGVLILVAVFIGRQTRLPDEFNIDYQTLILILFPTAISLMGIYFRIDKVLLSIFILLGIAVTLGVFIEKTETFWKRRTGTFILEIIIGIAVGLILALLNALPTHFLTQSPVKYAGYLRNTFAFLVLSITEYAFVVPGELFYRGVIWGLLRKFKWSEVNILLLTSGIFWLIHFRDFSDVYSIVSPLIVSLCLGFLVYRFKSLTPSLLAHNTYNAMRFFAIFILHDLFM